MHMHSTSSPSLTYLPPVPSPARARQLTHKEGALVGQATIRGAYINTASKDVGIDPNYHKCG